MATFDLYSYTGTSTESVFRSSIEPGQTIELDGIDGFFDQYFEGIDPTGETTIRFLPIEGNGPTLPPDAEAFERLSIFEATILRCSSLSGLVRVDRVRELGAWARDESIAAADGLSAILAASRPDPEKLEDLLRSAGDVGSALWRSEAKVWTDLDALSAVYVFSTRGQKRCLVLTNNAKPSYLVSLSGGR